MGIADRLLYNKEGRGIDANEPEKRPFIKFWEIAWLKRFKLILLNLLYFVCNLIPAALAAASYVLSVAFYFTLSKGISVTEAIQTSADPEGAQDMYFMGFMFVTMLFTILPVFSAGPFRAGFTYVINGFVKREPVFVWTDFMSKARSNLSLSLKSMAINGVVGLIIMITTAFYFACTSVGSNLNGFLPGWLLTVIMAFLLFSTVLFLAMNMYIYPMIITFRLTLKQLYKNAIIFAFVKWLPNIGILLITIALTIAPLLFINGYFAFIVALALYVFIGNSFLSYMHTFYVYPIIKKFMIDNPNADKSAEAQSAAENEEETAEASAEESAEDGESGENGIPENVLPTGWKFDENGRLIIDEEDLK